jgi:hypothetical protein
MSEKVGGISALAREFRTELATEARLIVYSRYLLAGLAIGIVAGIAATFGLNGKALSAHQIFQESLAESTAQGIILEEALSDPLMVIPVGSGTSIDNPLRYDFEYAASFLSLLQPWGYLANACKTASLILMPLIGFIAGAMLSAKEFRCRTIRVRAVRSRLLAVESSIAVGSALVCMASLVGCCAAALIFGFATTPGVTSQLAADFFSAGLRDIGPGHLATWASFCAAIGVFFAIIGAAVGLAFRTAVLPAVAFVCYALVLPMFGPWDIRSIWLTLATRMSDFEGALLLGGVKNDLSTSVNVVLLVTLALGFAALGHLVLRIRPRW